MSMNDDNGAPLFANDWHRAVPEIDMLEQELEEYAVRVRRAQEVGAQTRALYEAAARRPPNADDGTVDAVRSAQAYIASVAYSICGRAEADPEGGCRRCGAPFKVHGYEGEGPEYEKTERHWFCNNEPPAISYEAALGMAIALSRLAARAGIDRPVTG
jgi:hypothetical protein